MDEKQQIISPRLSYGKPMNLNGWLSIRTFSAEILACCALLFNLADLSGIGSVSPCVVFIFVWKRLRKSQDVVSGFAASGF
jgi:hypothetical protein